VSPLLIIREETNSLLEREESVVLDMTKVARARLFPKADTEVSSLVVVSEETVEKEEKMKGEKNFGLMLGKKKVLQECRPAITDVLEFTEERWKRLENR
jgi:hypothetical protein